MTTLSSPACQLTQTDHPRVIELLKTLAVANTAVNFVCRQHVEGVAFTFVLSQCTTVNLGHLRQLSLLPSAGREMSSSYSYAWWSPSVAMVCLLAAPWVQLLFVSASNGWPHNALRHHWLVPISCHFRDSKALLVTSLTHVSGAIASVQTSTFTFLPLVHSRYAVWSRIWKVNNECHDSTHCRIRIP